MLRTVCFDFGNSRQKAALFAGEQLQEVRVLDDTRTETVQALLQDWKPQRSIFSSVIDHDPSLP